MQELKLFVVVPCYNEEEVLYETNKRLSEKLDSLISSGAISPLSRILYVNDGSSDGTWNLIQSFHKDDERVWGISLSRNKGHQNALLAGLFCAKEHCDAAISMDADLQDDIDAVDAMVDKYKEGNDIVYGVRNSRKKDSFFKRNTAQMFYRVMKLLGAQIVYNHADYRLMSKRALDALSEYHEYNMFLRGIVPMVGFDSAVVYYERQERFAGKSKYPLKKMLSFAFEGITSLSIRPIRVITSLGAIVLLLSIIMMIYTFARHINGETVSGWSSLIISIWALGGLQIFCIGIIGEYIGKVYLETKARPKYIIKELLDDTRRTQDND